MRRCRACGEARWVERLITAKARLGQAMTHLQHAGCPRRDLGPAPRGLEGVDAARSRGLRVQSKPSACGRAPACAVAEAAAGPGSIVGQVAAPPSLGFPQAVTSKMQANRRAPIVLRLVLDLGLQDRLLAGGADLISS